MSAATFAATACAFYAAHHVGDYWVQTSVQAERKGLPGWAGRIACAKHVVTYTATLFLFTAATRAWLYLPLSLGWVLAGLGVSAVTHYFADRRKPLEWLAVMTGRGGFYRAGDGLATGAALLDQSWHWGWLFVSALVASGWSR